VGAIVRFREEIAWFERIATMAETGGMP